jgi:hypothetical protein
LESSHAGLIPAQMSIGCWSKVARLLGIACHLTNVWMPKHRDQFHVIGYASFARVAKNNLGKQTASKFCSHQCGVKPTRQGSVTLSM